MGASWTVPNSPLAGKVTRYGVGLIVAGGAIWLVTALAGAIAERLSGIPPFGTSGSSGTSGYPAHTVSDLFWAGYVTSIFAGAIGLLAIVVGLTAFRRGER